MIAVLQLILLRLNIIDNNSNYASVLKNKSAFFEQFAKIVYTKNEVQKTIDIDNLTPDNLEGKVVLQVDSDIKNAESYSLNIIIRNKEYIIKIK